MASKILTKKYCLTLFLILYFIKFGGLYPLSTYLRGSGLTYELSVLGFFLLCSRDVKKSFGVYRKWLFLFVGALFLNYISTFIFENRGLLTAIKSACFIHYLLLFFPLCIIKPSVRDVENVIISVGIYLLLLYFLQKILFPLPIVDSLISGWRAKNDAGEFDLMRFSLGGEIIMFLFQLLCFNRFLTSKKYIYIIGVILVVIMCILHGYRSSMLAMMISLMFLYIKVNSVKINAKTFSIFVLVFLCYKFVDQIPIVGDVLLRVNEKNENQFSSGINFMDLDRVIEFNFFYNAQLKNILEWVFGCGFLSKDEYAALPASLYWVNWVDLGFVGFSFMGGILITVCWIRLLMLNMRKIPIHFVYLAAFSIFVISSTITLNIAFADDAPAIQALALYLGFCIIKK